MPSLFLSYSRTDLSQVLPLLEELSAKELLIWRDQEKIQGGEKWPKVLGEAIDQHDFFLLAWSKQAAQSHFVELEWCTALALKKKIIPLRLDDTPLHPALRSLEAIQAHDRPKAISRILEATQQPSAQATHSQRAAVIQTLGKIPNGDPDTVLAKAKVLFDQEGWVVHGNTYQAGRDVNITHVTSPVSQTSLIGGLVLLGLIVIGFVFYITTGETDVVLEQEVGGSVLDEEGNPIEGVEVSLPKFQKMTKTDSQGHWDFRVQGPKQQKIEILVQKIDYQLLRSSGNLGNTGINFLLEKKK